MRFQIDQDYHIHSFLSTCAKDPAQTPERILQYALEEGLTEICLTDHYWDSAVPGASDWYVPQNFDHVAQYRNLPQTEGVRFFFGCETDMDKNGVIGLPASRFDDFDFIIVPTTHLHMSMAIGDKNAPCEYRAKIWVSRFDALLDSGLPLHKVGLAHMTCNLIYRESFEKVLETLSLIPDEELVRLFTRSAAAGCGIELNYWDMKHIDNPVVLRFYRIAKECGNKFYLGSDAHMPNEFPSKPRYEHAIDVLGLTENDKFRFSK